MSSPARRRTRAALPAVLALTVSAAPALAPDRADAQAPQPTASPDAAAPAPAGASSAKPARRRVRTLRVRRHVLAGRSSAIRGSVASGRARRTVLVQVRERRGWRTVKRTRTRSGGRFKTSVALKRPGRHLVRAVPIGRRVSGRSFRLHVYRAAVASWYGPGLYGNHLGCGGRLHPGTVGVAHKSLPCGTRVTFRYRGRTATLPVIDRGPYVGGREWDLTAAAKRKLGFGSTGVVWTTR